MKRILIATAMVLLMLGLVVLGAIGSLVKAGANTQPVLTVDATNATLTLPPQDGTQWGLFIFTIAPDGTQTPAGNGSGSVGAIQLPLPLNFCGQVQIDYGKFDDNGDFHKDVGHKYQVSTCETPTTTTTIGCPPNNTPPPCTVTTTTEPPTTTTTTAVPPVTTAPPSSGGGPKVPSVPQGVSAPPLTSPVAVSPVLAFTGAPVVPLAIIGSTLTIGGLLLMRGRRLVR